MINFRGFSPVNIFSKIWYTPKHWIASAINTPIIYFASGTNALNPMFANVRLIRQKTPIGASAMIIIVISIMISLNWLKKFATVSARSPNFARITPMINANTMICSISPLARELIGLSGIIFNSVSVNEVAFIVSTDAALVLIVLMSSPTPGLIRLPTVRATETARAVVARVKTASYNRLSVFLHRLCQASSYPRSTYFRTQANRIPVVQPTSSSV